jgi:molybdopterin molybdotransferase
MVAAILAGLGIQMLWHRHVPDDPAATREAAAAAIEAADVIVTVGGVSVGQRDYLPQTWQAMGTRTLLHGVNIQPGKPVFVARAGSRWILGLPGNPVSVLVTAHLFLWPLLKALSGSRDGGRLPWRPVQTAQSIAARSTRQVFRAAATQADNRVAICPWHGSGDLVHTGSADGLVRLPQQDVTLDPGAQVAYLPLLR